MTKKYRSAKNKKLIEFADEMIKIAIFVLILQNDFFDLAEETTICKLIAIFFDDSAKSINEFVDINMKIANFSH